MHKGRLEAFSDGVIAIIITIMVLELKAPHGHDLAALVPLLPVFISYVLSFVFIAIYWNNHHHMLQAAKTVNGKVLWANSHLLFWLSLIPFVTAWMGENGFSEWTVALYGVDLLFCAVAYYILSRALLAHHGQESLLGSALSHDLKGKISLTAYAVAIPLAFVAPWLPFIFYILVSVMWFVPDRRFERVLSKRA